MKLWQFSPQALGDLYAIWTFWTDRAGIESADRLETEFYEACDLLAERPMIGHIRTDVKRPVRFWNVREYLVIYRPDTVPLEILRLAHGSQDIPRVAREIP